MSATSKLRRRLRRKVARDEQLTPAQEQAFLRLMKVEPAFVVMPADAKLEWLEPTGVEVPGDVTPEVAAELEEPATTMLVDTGTELRMVPVSETVYGAFGDLQDNG